MLEVEHLSTVFVRGGARIPAIDDVSLRVAAGEFVGIIGPSGCGKSTFLHTLGGFIAPTRGEMRIAGRPVRGPGPDRGMMFQDLALFPWRTVLGNAMWGLEVQGRPRRECRAVAEGYLAMVGLLPFRDAFPAELSGGMKQRAALARVLAYEPAVLLMDEPFGALDAQTRELMQEELQRIWLQTRKTVVFVTHDIDEAVYLADRVVVFTARPGRIKVTVPIDLPRPRELEVKKTPAFVDYRNRLWDLLREEVLLGLARDGQPVAGGRG
ncbi:MAG: ABC transporter ATP-binding protein [Armatimonadota bacterium]|nr:ABC transporter ATP-binding protein [Armatimonadota bacterium]MDR7454557.1 ABC transporter ATP-binding protein [Armatimonadota bacterium]MDR7457114.1 ABC transporter ATP-binding protein [Armatimonadota bacterium]MDR7496592.1 ABC transporter ATP-binding protein [Armatimonadota bacterium]MDR7510614.1 ABC transporter ATP-binding protein [Armatimonadota bacterium]